MIITRSMNDILQLLRNGSSTVIDAGSHRAEDLVLLARNVRAPATLTLMNSDGINQMIAVQIASNAKAMVVFS